MKIAPIDITHKSFSRKMMGYDPEEVMDFLRMVSEQMETLVRERNELRENLRKKELSILEFRERDDLLKSTITTATKMSDQLREDAEREARLITNDAHQKAEEIIRDSRDSVKEHYQEITQLKQIRFQFENNIRAVVSSHMQMLEQAQKIMPSPNFETHLEFAENEEASVESAVNESIQQSLQE